MARRLFLFLAFAGIAAAQTTIRLGQIAADTAAQPPCLLLLTAKATATAPATYACATLGAGVALSGSALVISALTLPAPAVFVVPSTPAQTFTLKQAAIAAAYMVWRNGLLMSSGADYLVTAGVLTFQAAQPIGAGDIVQVW
jgi:hypothetical protein